MTVRRSPGTRARITLAMFALAFLGAGAWESAARACSASETEVYRSAKTVWCVEKEIVSKYGPFPKAFFPYGDSVVDELATLFDVPAAGVYTFEASTVTGGAHTGSECCGDLGVTVTGDAFYNDAYGSVGFWGYLLALHETINDWTGQVSSGWPTDFWADHISAFPNSMDWHVMATLGAKNNDANLVKASASQKGRFYPGGDTEDLRVPMFDQIFDLPGYGYPGLSRVFRLVQGDKLSWDDLGVANPNILRTEYVIAYLSLGGGVPVLPLMQKAHVGDGTDDGAGDPGYTVTSGSVDAVANAHCAIAAAAAAGANETADRAALQHGKLDAITAKGTCGAGCPAECGCKTASNRCVALWLSDTPGGGATDAGSSGGGTDAGAGGAGGAGSDAGNGGAGTGSGGGAPGHVDADAGGRTNGAGGAGGSGDASGGCSVHAEGEGAGRSGGLALIAASGFFALCVARARGRQRGSRR